jgi:cobalt-precorrin-5B (C1)-methyltransferase
MDSIVDPVSGFKIPEEWLRRSKDPSAQEKIRSGRWVLLCDGRMLERGYTTGTTAAAACKGAILAGMLPSGTRLDQVDVMTPAGIRVSLPTDAKSIKANEGLCIAKKFSGDHEFDITSGIEVIARAASSDEIVLSFGEGIGVIKGRGSRSLEGRPAVSQSARAQIMAAINEGLEIAGQAGADVVLSVPKGKALAAQTLNPKMGVFGGISILGSTGFVEPWNDHLSASRSMEIKGIKKVVVTTGRIGLKYSRILFPDHKAVLLGSRLEQLQFDCDQESILCGMPALILKWAWPEILEGTGYGTVTELVEMEPEHENIDIALGKARAKLPYTRIVLLYRDGRILRD